MVIVVSILKPITKVRTRGRWSSVERVGMPDNDEEADVCSQVIRSEKRVFFWYTHGKVESLKGTGIAYLIQG